MELATGKIWLCQQAFTVEAYDGLEYVPQVTEVAVGLPGMHVSSKPAERVLPDGWTVREVTLKEDLFVEIPFPAKVCFFLSGHSFQGPVNKGTVY